MGFLNSLLHNTGKDGSSGDLKQELDIPFEIKGSKKARRAVTEIINRTAKSEAGRAVLEKAAKAGYKIKDEYLENAFGACDGDKKLILLDTHFPKDKLVSTLAHEARHAEQMENGAIKGYDPTKTIASALVEKRLMEGDAVAYSLLVCDELREKGDVRPAVALAHQFPEMSKGFYDGKRASPTGDKVRDAMTGAVMGWFFSERLKMRYELTHVVNPLSLGLNLNTNPASLEKVDAAQSVAKICAFNHKPYFTADESRLGEAVFCGVSRSTKYWINAHVAAVKACGGQPEPSVESIPVYHERPSNRVGLNAYPAPLLPCAQDKIKSGGMKKALKQTAAKAVNLLKLKAHRGR